MTRHNAPLLVKKSHSVHFTRGALEILQASFENSFALVECWSSAAQDNKFDTLTLRHFDTLTAKINPDAHYENQIRLTIKIKRKEGR